MGGVNWELRASAVGWVGVPAPPASGSRDRCCPVRPEMKHFSAARPRARVCALGGGDRLLWVGDWVGEGRQHTASFSKLRLQAERAHVRWNGRHVGGMKDRGHNIPPHHPCPPCLVATALDVHGSLHQAALYASPASSLGVTDMRQM